MLSALVSQVLPMTQLQSGGVAFCTRQQVGSGACMTIGIARLLEPNSTSTLSSILFNVIIEIVGYPHTPLLNGTRRG